MAFTVTAANIDERDVVPNLYGTIHGLLIGDKGFISEDLKLEAAAHEIDLQTPLRKNMPENRDPDAVARLMRIRRMSTYNPFELLPGGNHGSGEFRTVLRIPSDLE